MQTVTTEWLQSLDALKEVPEEQLRWWLENSVHYEVLEGELFIKTGEPSKGTHVIVSGRIKVFAQQNKGTRNIDLLESGRISGYLPFSRGTVAPANGLVIEKAQVMTFPIEKMKELILHNFELTQALVHVMTTRVREITAQEQQSEKMMALGKLSAGLAHELNNPAAAIVRGSVSLLKHIKVLPKAFKQVIAIKMSPEDVDKVSDKMFEVLARKEKPVLTLMQRTALEDELAECLEEKMVLENSEEIAENLVDFGFTCEDINDLVRIVPPEYLPQILTWINNNLVTEKMVTDIQESSERISRLVNAVKNFTHMDRGNDKVCVDIHTGITNTLTMLSHKIKQGKVQLIEEYDTSLPPVKAFVGELNQVWTNLIDNALDAMEVNKQGTLHLKTKRDREFVTVSISDDGPGIPDDIKSRIFDPFFTTKDIGKGTGLGLDVVSRIVKQHGGTVQAVSKPGETTFIVCFPIDEK